MGDVVIKMLFIACPFGHAGIVMGSPASFMIFAKRIGGAHEHDDVRTRSRVGVRAGSFFDNTYTHKRNGIIGNRRYFVCPPARLFLIRMNEGTAFY